MTVVHSCIKETTRLAGTVTDTLRLLRSVIVMAPALAVAAKQRVSSRLKSNMRMVRAGETIMGPP
jgi:hypothetical protein